MAIAHERFEGVVANYPVRSATLAVSVGGFDRSGSISASSTATVDIGWAAFLLLPSHVKLRSQVVLKLEPWRSHSP